MKVLDVVAADVQVTFQAPLSELRQVVSAANRIEIRFDSGSARETEEKDAFLAFLKTIKTACDEIGGADDGD